ncbi:MAG: hypothetical protein QY326_07880 [Bdellovibrionota bacterium]|nr:MAG: hypothetical protein QY326_07880 [Bdellovibrionota bacterium]
MESWQKHFQHRGVTYCAEFVKRPFREGIEVSVEVDGTVIRFAELGLGEQALIHRLKFEIDSFLRNQRKDESE